jgi:hypothetical protein
MTLEKDLVGMSLSCDGLMELLVSEIMLVPSRSQRIAISDVSSAIVARNCSQK